MSENLWTLAALKLSEKDRDSLGGLQSTPQLDEILSAVNSRKQECVEKQWVIKRGGNKGAIVLRDVFKKIAIWVQKFVDVGDVAVSSDPGHAALPWAAVRFILIVSIKDVQQYAVVAEGAETTAKIIVQCAIVEKLYLCRSNEATSELRKAVIEVYAAALRFLAKSLRFYDSNTATRALKTFVTSESKFRERLNNIDKAEQGVKKWAAWADAENSRDLEYGLETLSLMERSHHERLRSQLREINEPISRMESHLLNLRDDLESSQRTDILTWMSPIPYIKHHSQSKKDLLVGTGQWFLNSDQLLEWRRSSSSSILWLRGSPGTGKSKLVSIVTEQLLNEYRNGLDLNPVYFYCTRNPAEPERADPEIILQSVARQMSCLEPGNPIFAPARIVYERRRLNDFAAGSLSSAESVALILEMVKYRPLTTIIIDALDECDPRRRSELLEALTEILETSDGLIKILVSSRDDGSIVCHFSGCLNLTIQADRNQTDIDRFVDFEVDHLIRSKKLLLGRVSPSLRLQIKHTLGDQAHGMFRWVSLQLQFLRDFRLESSIAERLGELPANLRDLYEETFVLQRKQRDEAELLIADDAFRLLLCRQEPLKSRDFLQVLGHCREGGG